jgi:hypothetical protein
MPQGACDRIGVRFEVLLHDLTRTNFECAVPGQETDPLFFTPKVLRWSDPILPATCDPFFGARAPFFGLDLAKRHRVEPVFWGTCAVFPAQAPGGA